MCYQNEQMCYQNREEKNLNDLNDLDLNDRFQGFGNDNDP